MINKLNIDYTIISSKLEYYAKYLTMSINSYSMQTFFALERELKRLVDSFDGKHFIDGRIVDYNADGIVSPERYESFIEYIYNNINISIKSHNSMSKTINNYITDVSARIISLDNLTNKIKNDINKYEIREGHKKSIIINETFKDVSKINLNKTDAEIINGALRIKPISIDLFNNICNANIIDRFSSDNDTTENVSEIDKIAGVIGNGFKGNNLECKIKKPLFDSSDSNFSNSIVNYSLSNRIDYVDYEGKKSDVNNIFDTRWNTSFEYELVNIPDKYKEISNGYGLEYQYTDSNGDVHYIPWYNPTDMEVTENISNNISTENIVNRSLVNYDDSNYMDYTSKVYGIEDLGGKLKLVLSVNLSSPKNINNIYIDFNINNNAIPTIKESYVFNLSKNEWEKCDIDFSSDGDAFVIIPSGIVNTNNIIFIIEQDKSYNTQIIHQYYYRSDTNTAYDNINIAVTTNQNYISKENRVNGPSRIIGSDGKVSRDIMYRMRPGIIGPSKEVFPGWRYSININTLYISNVVFNTEATVVTYDYVLPIDIRDILLEVDAVEYKDNNASIKYYFSIDMGVNWLPISDINDSNPIAPKKYRVAIDDSIDSSFNVVTNSINSDNVTIIYLKNETNRIKFKAVLKSNEESNISPILKGYKLHLKGE